MSSQEERCPECGRRYYTEAHVIKCRGAPFHETETCPMCGEPFESYLDHLKRCDAG